MELLGDLGVLLHLVGFAALLGGALVQLGSRHPEVNGAMLHGAWIELVTGAGLVVLLVVRHQDVHYLQNGIKLALTLFLLLLVAKNRKYESIPRGLLLLLAVLTLAGAALSVLWR